MKARANPLIDGKQLKRALMAQQVQPVQTNYADTGNWVGLSGNAPQYTLATSTPGAVTYSASAIR